MSDEQKSKAGGRSINTGGGAYVEGKVKVSGGGDFVGRDKTVTYNYGTDVADTVFSSFDKAESRPR